MRKNKFFSRALCSLVAFSSLFNTVSADNPIISQRYTADPNAFIFNDRMYVICSSDEDNVNSYNLINYTLISSDDMVNWAVPGRGTAYREQVLIRHARKAPVGQSAACFTFRFGRRCDVL
jgi:hypothetical protein